MVEWKKLGEVCEIKTGKGITQKECSEDAPYPVISGGQSPMGMYKDYNRDAKTVTISRVGAYAGFVSYITEKFYLNDKCFSIIPNKENILPLYLFLYLKSIEEIIKSLQSEGGVPTINTTKLATILIPIPSLSEQQRIVSILDTFTSSISNLKQQIEERRKQYEYERDLLLDLEGKEGVEMKKLGEVAKVLRGKRLTKNLLDDNAPYPVFHGGIEPLGRYRDYNREANTVMVINVGASAGTVGFCDCKFWSSDGCFCISHSEVLNNKFLFYYLETKMHYLQSQVRHAGIPTLDNPIIEKILVPLLSLQAQSRIVSILDTIEQSIANLEEQLAMREKQYEYYREKLLRFEEA